MLVLYEFKPLFYLISLPKTFLTYFAAMFLHAKKAFLTSNVKEFVYKLHASPINIYFGRPRWDDAITWIKVIRGRRNFSFTKAQNDLGYKNLPPSRDGIIFTCNQK